MSGGSHFNSWDLAGGLSSLRLGGLTINNSVTILHPHNFSDGESDAGTARTGNQVGARSRAHDSGVLTPDDFNDAPYVPPQTGQSLPQAYGSTHTLRSTGRAHDIPSVSNPSAHLQVILFFLFFLLQYPSPGAESHLSVDSNWSSSSSSDQEDSFTSHSQYQQYNPSVSRQSSSNEHQHLQHLQQPHSHYPAYEGLHRLGLEHVGYPPQPPANSTTVHYRPPARPAYQSNNILALEFYEQIDQDLPLPIHLSQTRVEQSSASPSSSHGSLSTFSTAPTTNEKSRHLLFEDAGPYLRGTLHIPLYKAVNLWALPDPPEGEKPNQPYPILIKLAIYGSPNKQLALQEIYTALEDRFQWFKLRRNEKAWKVGFHSDSLPMKPHGYAQNSIRHNLSLNKVFKHVPRAIAEPGKGSYWQLDCSGGEGYKRPRKRCSKSARAALDQGDDDDSSLEGNIEGTNAPQAGMPAGSSHAPNRPSPVASDDSYIDPKLRQGSHIVGEGRTRSALRRSATSPYPVPSPQQSPRYPQNQLSPHVSPESAPRFGQPSFGQGGFGRPGFSQMPAARVPQTSASSSSAFVASSPATFGHVPVTSTRPQHAFATRDRNTPIIQPTPRPGVKYVYEGGLPSARRVQGYHQGPYQSSQGLPSS
jgi:hypothetical protein